MSKRRLVGTVAAVIAAGAVVLYAYQRWGDSGSSARNDVLRQMPADAGAVLYLDVDALRQSPFLAALYKWAPEPQADPDYSQFLESTGFHYERDLHRVSMALLKRGRNSQFFAVADGRFDDEVRTEHAADGARLGRRLDDDERLTHGTPRGASVGMGKGRAWSRQSGGPSPACQGQGVGAGPLGNGPLGR